jgi:hypothetical protein
MPIPIFNSHGLLPQGIHDCTVSEIEERLTWNLHRTELFLKFKKCLENEVEPRFPNPVFFDGSYVTNKEYPEDIDIVLDLRQSSMQQQLEGLIYMQESQDFLMNQYNVHFWINLACQNDFSAFFQYVGVKTAKLRGLSPSHLKGILRLT